MTSRRFGERVVIRDVRPEEYAEAGRVTALAYMEFLPPDPGEGWLEYLAEIADIAGRAGRTAVLGAFDDDAVLGTATIEMDERTIGDDDPVLPPEMAGLRMLGVDPAHRGRGIGRALVEACIERARRAGKTVFTLRTTPAMHVAHRMYESMGFRRDPERDMSFPEVELLAYRLEL